MHDKIIVDKYTYGYNGIKIANWGENSKLYIGKFCSIASNVTVFLGGNHDWRRATTYPFGSINTEIFPYEKILSKTNGDVIIENDVWIGQGATIMSGVKICNGAVIAANSHVIKKVKPYSVVGGNPTEVYCYRFDDDIIKRFLELKWWNWDVEKINRYIPEMYSGEFIDLLCDDEWLLENKDNNAL
jgi:acetyltransferase-like isoleucine patch superfamily enzyme